MKACHWRVLQAFSAFNSTKPYHREEVGTFFSDLAEHEASSKTI